MARRVPLAFIEHEIVTQETIFLPHGETHPQASLRQRIAALRALLAAQAVALMAEERNCYDTLLGAPGGNRPSRDFDGVARFADRPLAPPSERPTDLLDQVLDMHTVERSARLRSLSYRRTAHGTAVVERTGEHAFEFTENADGYLVTVTTFRDRSHAAQPVLARGERERLVDGRR
jgi:hypothetical protein